jgi:hypothetical protein
MKINYKNQSIIESMLEFMLRKAELGIILSVCLTCQEIYGVKLGHGVQGLSHGYCPEHYPVANSKPV